MAAVAGQDPVSPSAVPASILALWTALGIDAASVAARRLPLWEAPARLAWADLGSDGRDRFLTPPAAAAWQRMREAASAHGVTLQLVSAFRSLHYQAALIQRKLDAGIGIEQALSVLAPPGCSEHHSGRAVDIGTPGCNGLEERFETTAAFDWLSCHAGMHGFHLSFPRGNAQGFIYEPWHWCFAANDGATED